jgi:hypothetical protein
MGALVATRSIVWFSYAGLLLLPQLLERCWREPPSQTLMRRQLAAFALLVCVCGFVKLAALERHGMRPVADHWPAPAAAAVRRAIHEDSRARVLANGEYADWLLFEIPELRGRIAFDGRWEVLSPRQFLTVRDYLFQTGAGWEQPSRGYRVLVLDPKRNRRLVATYDHRGLRVLYRGGRVVVYEKS